MFVFFCCVLVFALLFRATAYLLWHPRILHQHQQHHCLWKECDVWSDMPWCHGSAKTICFFTECKACHCMQTYKVAAAIGCKTLLCWRANWNHHLFGSKAVTSWLLPKRWLCIFKGNWFEALPSVVTCGHWAWCVFYGVNLGVVGIRLNWLPWYFCTGWRCIFHWNFQFGLCSCTYAIQTQTGQSHHPHAEEVMDDLFTTQRISTEDVQKKLNCCQCSSVLPKVMFWRSLYTIHFCKNIALEHLVAIAKHDQAHGLWKCECM